MALILLNEKRIRCDKIRQEDKKFTLRQILKPESVKVMDAIKNV